jgi:hypothetical protein
MYGEQYGPQEENGGAQNNNNLKWNVNILNNLSIVRQS